ncbi:hypothetical protein AGABI1DRAFT_93680 [Agaricus bisporus var. burnettii JB137-S8]|uniref:Uncharacterized protein n=1 Tax=Agaricus bisporus var. burnettii (strain JB137-S8 / ATCC MYA-4627 / FGSC 10392) TaxID=597362 RepID=K5XQE4_AGABU|nr:uncharacterized protein AGABI1DRAFT_93680 [Agaricus bisporus var. burnettii JB137-S8]EKM77015.1 hypothetical protein AGABI1DRAFT_93680 [Agaricus bisporus var. burnettii JB137-S8]
MKEQMALPTDNKMTAGVAENNKVAQEGVAEEEDKRNDTDMTSEKYKAKSAGQAESAESVESAESAGQAEHSDEKKNVQSQRSSEEANAKKKKERKAKKKKKIVDVVQEQEANVEGYLYWDEEEKAAKADEQHWMYAEKKWHDDHEVLHYWKNCSKVENLNWSIKRYLLEGSGSGLSTDDKEIEIAVDYEPDV